ncbi:MAG: toxin-antitoxin system YwqK family antitoxin [Campylobacteraceae bacterium]
MRLFFSTLFLSSALFANTIFFNEFSNKWYGVTAINCGKNTSSSNAAKMPSFKVGDFFFETGKSCKQITKILNGDVKVDFADKTWSFAHYEDGVIFGWYRVFLPNNALKSEQFFNNGVKEGLHKEFYKDGTLKLEENYKDNMLNGMRVEYEFNGRPLRVNFYYNDKKHGIERVYNAQGRPFEEFDYIDNIKQPRYRKYYYGKDGQFSHKGSFLGNTKDGSWIYYDDKGEAKKEIIFLSGVESSTIDRTKTKDEQLPLSNTTLLSLENNINVKPTYNNSSGYIVTKQTIESALKEKNLKESETKEVNTPSTTAEAQKVEKVENIKISIPENIDIFENALVNTIYEIDKTRAIDNLAIFYNNLQKKWYAVITKSPNEKKFDALNDKEIFISSYIKDINKEVFSIPTGTIRVSAPAQNTWESAEVKEGVMDGWYNSYFEDGKQKISIYYQNGQKQGVAKEFDKNEKLITKWFYVNDKIDGLVSFYYPNGLLRAAIPFKNSLADGNAYFFDENGVISKRINYKNGWHTQN